ncbi:transcriptional regulator, AraC family, partial [Vibrio parahaemolyticus AQ3810]
EASHFSLHLTQHASFEAEQSEFAQQNKLRFGDKFDGILLKASLLNAKNHQDEDALERHFQQHLKELQTRYPNNLSDQAANMIGRLLSTGECSVERVARALDLHPRMLQSKLKQQGTSYLQLLTINCMMKRSKAATYLLAACAGNQTTSSPLVFRILCSCMFAI